MRINVESKFNIDQEVFCIEDYSVYEKCETCNGEKEIKVIIGSEERIIECPDCDGTGEGEFQLELWRMKCGNKSWKIGAVEIAMWKHNNCRAEFTYNITYSHDGGGNTSAFIDEKNCFSTLQEALNEIERRNNECKHVDDSE